jgi:hypothetical protein
MSIAVGRGELCILFQQLIRSIKHLLEHRLIHFDRTGLLAGGFVTQTHIDFATT